MSAYIASMVCFSYFVLLSAKKIPIILGVIKTHKLVLLTPTNVLSPRLPSLSSESRITIGPRALKDILEHFPHTKGVQNDPQLLWLFGMNSVKVKTYQSNVDTKGLVAQFPLCSTLDKIHHFRWKRPTLN